MCGNFCFTGAQSGRIEKYNIQSGLHRGTALGHSACVTVIQCDGLNKWFFSAGLDKTIRVRYVVLLSLFAHMCFLMCVMQVWDFASCTQVHSIATELPVSRILLHRDNMLLAAVLDDLSIGARAE